MSEFEEYRAKSAPFSLRDNSGGRWLCMAIMGRDGTLGISRDYRSESDGPFVESSLPSAPVDKIAAYSSSHNKASESSPFYTDQNGAFWITTQKLTGFLSMGGLRYFAMTAWYGGVAVDAASVSILAGTIKRIAGEEILKGPVKDPGVVPTYAGTAPAEPTPYPVATSWDDVIIAPPRPVGVAQLSDPEYNALATVAKSVKANPLDLLAVAYAESGLHTTSAARDKNGNAIAFGVTQFTRTGAASIGMTPAHWSQIPNMSFTQQMELARKFFEHWGRKGSFETAVTLYQTNFAPATVGSGSDVIYQAPSLNYNANAGLDNAGPNRTKKGYVGVSDLAEYLQRIVQEPGFKTHLSKMNALGYLGSPNLSTGGGSAAVGFAIVAALGGGLWWLSRRDLNSTRSSSKKVGG